MRVNSIKVKKKRRGLILKIKKCFLIRQRCELLIHVVFVIINNLHFRLEKAKIT